ncbi:MAG: phosphodiester glycosidase family protein [Thermodesulfobacteriota bacterium]
MNRLHGENPPIFRSFFKGVRCVVLVLLSVFFSGNPAFGGQDPSTQQRTVTGPAGWFLEDKKEDSGSDEKVPNIPWPPEAIAPLYTSPTLAGEGIWKSEGLPGADEGPPVLFSTTYRPSVEYPNAVVHMLACDMKRLRMRMYLGSSEPGGSTATAQVESEMRPHLLAITNGLWKIRHAGKGGIVIREKEVKRIEPGLATLVIFKDGKVDILEWQKDMDLSHVQDAKQLKHLIVQDGKVVTCLKKRGKELDAEIGLGSLLNEDKPFVREKPDDPKSKRVMNITSGDQWFIATRSAFGIREDGNLVFAVGRHISTKDLAKALALAGCVRAIHGDANPGNCLANLYFTDKEGSITKKERLFDGQDRSTLQRYLDKSYTSDFYAFFRK